MELVSGQTFEQLIEQTGPMSVERAAPVVASPAVPPAAAADSST